MRWLIALAVLAACGDDDRERSGRVIVPLAGVEAPAAGDRRERCGDVVDARACWVEAGDGCADGVCSVARPVPPMDDPGAWRCHGNGAERSCFARRRAGGAFVCSSDSCTQEQPRLPDAAWWECIDDEGVVVCRGGEPAAGVFPAEPDPGYVCGARRGEPHRVCVDLSPDLPAGDARGWRCHFTHDAGEKRVCVRDGDAPAAAAPCDGDGSACVRGTVCAGDRCLPVRIAPECWLDRDCGTGNWCRFGTCLEGTR